MFFRKKPVIVEAMQWDGTLSNASEIIDWVLEHPDVRHTPSYWDASETTHQFHPELHISTLDGVLIVNPGDWIIITIPSRSRSPKKNKRFYITSRIFISPSWLSKFIHYIQR